MTMAAAAQGFGLPFWWDGFAPAPLAPDGPPERCDILVIGGGYTGLGAARAASDAGADVVLIDAGVPGEGAAGRNGGMFGAHPRLAWDELARRFDAPTADAVYSEAPVALVEMRRLIAEEGIDCALAETGRLQLAWSGAHWSALQRLHDWLCQKSAARVRLVKRRDLGGEIATDRYFGGLVFEEHCGIDPRRFHDGLLRAAHRRGVKVIARCPATRVTRSPGGFAIDTPKGKIRAEKVILATSGYTQGAFGWFSRRVFPLPSFMIATAPLDPETLARLAPGRRMMVETRARHAYWRLSPDGGRILFGGRAAMRPIDPAHAATRLARALAEIWPALADVPISHSWSGFTGFSFNHVPALGEHEGIVYAMGFSGSGTVLAPYLGTKAGRLAAGAAGADTAFGRTRLRTRWIHPGTRPHFLLAADPWFRYVVDRREDRSGRRPHP